jgi:hypothetical protein
MTKVSTIEAAGSTCALVSTRKNTRRHTPEHQCKDSAVSTADTSVVVGGDDDDDNKHKLNSVTDT